MCAVEHISSIITDFIVKNMNERGLSPTEPTRRKSWRSTISTRHVSFDLVLSTTTSAARCSRRGSTGRCADVSTSHGRTPRKSGSLWSSSAACKGGKPAKLTLFAPCACTLLFAVRAQATAPERVEKSEEEWRAILNSPEQSEITRKRGRSSRFQGRTGIIMRKGYMPASVAERSSFPRRPSMIPAPDGRATG